MIRAHWPRVEILVRADSHYAAPEVFDLGRTSGVDFISPWRTAQFDTIRLRLLKIAARVVEMKTRLRVHLPTACTVQPVLAIVLTRTTRLVT
ncbi:hypothetical protein GE253_17120 [Niveispirillum sp. SYP-B3756]|nr:hypothetical protein [Niveispirillum sp. SYP-B3756]